MYNALMALLLLAAVGALAYRLFGNKIKAQPKPQPGAKKPVGKK